MRVYELAKNYGLESKDVLSIAKKHRIQVKQSASATIEDKDIRKLLPLIQKFKEEESAKQVEEKRKSEEESRRRDEERRQRDEERRRELEEKRRAEEVGKRTEEVSRRTEEQQQKQQEEEAARAAREQEKRNREEAERLRREAETRRREEEARLRSLGLPVPTRRPTDYLPSAPPVTHSRPAPGSTPTLPPRPVPGGGTGSLPPRPSIIPGAGSPRPLPPRHDGPQPSHGPGGRPPFGGQRPQGQGNYQGRPGGGERSGDRPMQLRSDRPPGQYGPRPDRPQGDRPRPDRPQGDRPQGDRPQGERQPYGDRPQGDRPYGDRPPRPQGQGGFDRRDSRQGPGGPRPQGDRPYPPREGRPGGPGGRFEGDRGPRPGGPGGPRRDDGGGQRGPGRFDGDRGPRPGAPGAGAAGGAPSSGLQIGVMRLDKGATRRPADKDRKPAAGSPAKGRGKVAPRKIFELDEDLTAKPKVPAGRVGGGRSQGRNVPEIGGQPRYGSKRRGPRNRKGHHSHSTSNISSSVFVTPPCTVGAFAEACGVPATEIIKRCMILGEMLNINANISEDMMSLIAAELGIEIEIEKIGDEYDIEAYLPESDEERLVRRAPVVTIMGHVDHGKTSLLDYIRRSKVAEGEFGGITQHIGAYHVNTSKGDIVFLDTPGHEAFTSMRARGAQITDIVILVVAADDGFKPQTIEAVHHAQAAEVPIVVAVNKIDLPGADPAKVRQEALKHGLVPEEYGGQTIFVDVSAKKGINVDNLLEMVALQAEILDLKADAGTHAMGLVIESHVDPLRGAVATILVEQGTLRMGDDFVIGDVHGRVRAMRDDLGRDIEEAGPATPVEILGLSGSPGAGEIFLVVPDERIARGIAEKRSDRRRVANLNPVQGRHMTLENLHERLREGETKDLNIIVKADVQGSIEAVGQALEKLTNEQVTIHILHSAVGGITENDVYLAAASDAVILGFNVRPDARTEELAEQEQIEIKTYRIIYDLLEDVKAAMAGLLAPTKREKILGHAEILQLFRSSKVGTIAGCIVRDGEITRNSKIRLLRDGIVIYDGTLASLKRLKEDARKVTQGLECGMAIENYNDVREHDVIEAYEIEEFATELILS